MDLFRFERVSLGSERGARLSRVSLCVPDDGITVVVGPSGAGKTTLLRLCNRLEVPDAGRVLFRGDDVARLDPLHLRRRVGLVFQQPVVFGGTVRDNLRVAVPDGEEADLVAAVRRAELTEDFLDRPADELSGGEAQRVCLARTLATRPEVLLVDEPTAGLDAAPKRRLEGLVRHLAEGGVPALWVTHELDQMRRLADRVVVLVAGEVRYAGDVGGLERSDDAVVASLVGGDGGERRP